MNYGIRMAGTKHTKLFSSVILLSETMKRFFLVISVTLSEVQSLTSIVVIPSDQAW